MFAVPKIRKRQKDSDLKRKRIVVLFQKRNAKLSGKNNKINRDLRCNIPVKDSHQHNFPESYSDVYNEHGERFYKDIMTMKRRYEEKGVPAMFAYY